MKKTVFLGSLVIMLALAFVGCDDSDDDNLNEETNGVEKTEKNESLYFQVAYSDGSPVYWSSQRIKLDNYYSGTLNSNTTYDIALSGNLDVNLSAFQVYIYGYGGYDYDIIGRINPRTNIPAGSFNNTFTLTTSNFGTYPEFYVDFKNHVTYRGSYAIVANISNFSMKITEKEEETTGKLYFKKQVGGFGSASSPLSSSRIKLNNYYSGTLSKNTTYDIILSGTSDEEINQFEIYIYGYKKESDTFYDIDWGDYDHVGNPYPIFRDTSLNMTLSRTIPDQYGIDLPELSDIYIEFQCRFSFSNYSHRYSSYIYNDLDYFPNGSIMATISDFSMTMTEK